VPLIWRFQKSVAGSGSHGDLNAHIIDMARFITGEEITEISGAIAETFIKERNLPSQGPSGGIAGGTKGGGQKGKSDVDDAVLFLARFAGGLWRRSRPRAWPRGTRTAMVLRSTVRRARSNLI